MNYIVFDLEWNQAQSHDNELALHFEIIEIGAVKLDENLQIIDQFSALVCPQVYPHLTPITSQVTHLSEELLKQEGRPFVEVANAFLNWCGNDAFFCTWGISDLSELQKNMDFYQMKDKLPKPLFYYDIQKWYSLFYEDGKTRRALETAVENLVLPQTRPFHRAISDAYYTALVMQTMDFEQLKSYRSIDYHNLPTNRKEEIYILFDNYSKFVSQIYPTKEQAMQNSHITSMTCFRCKHSVTQKIRWFSWYGKHYYALGYCPTHGWLKGKIRFKKPETPENGIFVVKTIKYIDSQEAKLIAEKRASLRDKRKLHLENE